MKNTVTAQTIRDYITNVTDLDATRASAAREKLAGRMAELRAQIDAERQSATWSDWAQSLIEGTEVDLDHPRRAIEHTHHRVPELEAELEYLNRASNFMAHHKFDRTNTVGDRLAYLADTLATLVAEVKAIGKDHPEPVTAQQAVDGTTAQKAAHRAQATAVAAYAELRTRQYDATHQARGQGSSAGAVTLSGHLRDALEHLEHWLDMRRTTANNGAEVTLYSLERWAWFGKAPAPRWKDLGRNGYPADVSLNDPRAWTFLLDIVTNTDPWVPTVEELQAQHEANLDAFTNNAKRRPRRREAFATI